jgi:hypothetical protein
LNGHLILRCFPDSILSPKYGVIPDKALAVIDQLTLSYHAQ